MSAVGGDLSRLHLPSQQKLDQMIARAKQVNFADGSGVVADPKVEFRAIARLIEETDGIDNIYI